MGWWTCWKMPGVLQANIQRFWMHWAVPLLKQPPNFLDVLIGKNHGTQVSWTIGQDTGRYHLIHLPVSQGKFWLCITCFIKYPVSLYLVTLAKCPPKNVMRQHHWVHGAKPSSLSKSSQQYQPKYWELLLTSGLNCTVWVHVTPNYRNLVCSSLQNLLRKWWVHSCWRKNLHHTVERTPDTILGMGRNQLTLELVTVANGMGAASEQWELTMLSCTSHIWQLVFNKYL